MSPSHLLRTSLVVGILLGSMVLAVPHVSTAVDHLLYGETANQWKAKPTEPAPLPLDPSPTVVPAGSRKPAAMVAHPTEPTPLAFDWQADVPEKPDFAARRTVHEETVSDHDETSLRRLQSELESLGATYVVVESLGEEDRTFECRCLFPVQAGSTYQKAFAARGSEPSQAMLQVISQVERWQATRRR